MILRGPFLSFVFSLILFSMKNQGDWNEKSPTFVFISFVILLLILLKCKFSTILFSMLCFSAPNP